MANKFDNVSDAALVDEFGFVKAQIDALEKREKELRDEIVARFDDVPLAGARWTATVSTSASKRLDTKALRALLGDALNDYEKESVSTRVNVRPTMVLGEAAE